MLDDPAGFVTETLAPNWWVFVGRGLLALLFGVLAVVMPAGALSALVLVFGLFALFDGLLTVGASFPAASVWVPWSSLTLRGLLGVAAGVFALARPEATLQVLQVVVYLIALWAVAGGTLEIVAAVQDHDAIPSAWLLGLGGAAAIVFGVFAAGAPQAGAGAMMGVLGAFALVAGAVRLAFGFRLLGANGRPAVTAARNRAA
jgi:uncharacterized membrane protein HdeD (DUF308 family)